MQRVALLLVPQLLLGMIFGPYAITQTTNKAKISLCSLLTAADAQRITHVPMMKVHGNDEECVYSPTSYGGVPIDMVGLMIQRGTWASEKQGVVGAAPLLKASLENVPGIGDEAVLSYSKEAGGTTMLLFHKGTIVLQLTAGMLNRQMDSLKDVAKKIAGQI
ncbi:MAG: hypothetical protein JO356_12500 [Acidobacteria bacterium]|nr:hypothetical protein [Acidobacteriota bacterium]